MPLPTVRSHRCLYSTQLSGRWLKSTACAATAASAGAPAVLTLKLPRLLFVPVPNVLTVLGSLRVDVNHRDVEGRKHRCERCARTPMHVAALDDHLPMMGSPSARADEVGRGPVLCAAVENFRVRVVYDIKACICHWQSQSPPFFFRYGRRQSQKQNMAGGQSGQIKRLSHVDVYFKFTSSCVQRLRVLLNHVQEAKTQYCTGSGRHLRNSWHIVVHLPKCPRHMHARGCYAVRQPSLMLAMI